MDEDAIIRIWALTFAKDLHLAGIARVEDLGELISVADVLCEAVFGDGFGDDDEGPDGEDEPEPELPPDDGELLPASGWLERLTAR